MRLALDYARDVDEALAMMRDYNVDFPQACTHYLFADASGDSAVVEYIDGQPIIIRSEEAWQVATNFLIAEQQPEGAGSECWRYNSAYEALDAAGGQVSREEAMSIVREASVDTTVWSVVYNLTTGSIDVAMGGNYAQVHSFAQEMSRGHE